MFNKDFYPTPQEVIAEMTSGLDLYGKHILEPSAGKGDIIKFCKSQGAKIYACEIDKQLQTFVKKECDNFLGDDFLTLTKDYVSHIDYVIMNPPFSADDKHLLHAWDIAPDGCQIISLINHETYYNDYCKDREILKKVINDYGHYQKLGNVFDTAERKTNVIIGLVVLYKPINELEFESSYFDLQDEKEKEQGIGVITYNEVEEFVSRYISAIKVYDKQADLALEMHNALSGVFYHVSRDFAFTIQDQDGVKVSKERFKVKLQKEFWQHIFYKLKMEKYQTRNLKQTMNRFIERQQQIPFTVKNIYKMLHLIVGTHKSRMEQVLVEVFDKITMHHADNRYGLEGWVTNSHYMLNEKFILEDAAHKSKYFGTMEAGFNAELLDDLTKALCYLTGVDYADIFTRFSGVGYSFFSKNPTNYWISAGFFEVKFYKKGTAHVKFNSKELCEKLNREVARIKGYPLPEHL
jgi:predicted RNA methylase